MPAQIDPDCNCPPSNCGELVSRYPDDIDGAGSELSKNVKNKIDKIVRNILGPDYRSDWDDVHQNVLMRMIIYLSTWRGEKKFCHWVAVIAVNASLTFRDLVAGRSATQETLDEQNHPAMVIDHELRDCIQHVQKQMTDDERHVSKMRSEGFEIQEIAEAMGVSVRTINIHLAKIRLKLTVCYKMRPTGYGRHDG